MEIIRSRDKYFDDLANYLITLVSLTLTQELYASGQAGRYGPNHRVQLDAKQAAKRLIFYPYTLLEDMFVDKWPDRLILREEPVEIDPSAISASDPLQGHSIPRTVNACELLRARTHRHRNAVRKKFQTLGQVTGILRG
jgi:hypothetical protein